MNIGPNIQHHPHSQHHGVLRPSGRATFPDLRPPCENYTPLSAIFGVPWLLLYMPADQVRDRSRMRTSSQKAHHLAPEQLEGHYQICKLRCIASDLAILVTAAPLPPLAFTSSMPMFPYMVSPADKPVLRRKTAFDHFGLSPTASSSIRRKCGFLVPCSI